MLDARFRFPRIPWLPADAGKNLLCVKMCWLHSKVLCAGCQVGFISVFRSLCVWSSYHPWRALCSLVSLSLCLGLSPYTRLGLISQSDFRILAELLPHSSRAFAPQIYGRLWCMFIPFCWHCTVPRLGLGLGIRANAATFSPRPHYLLSLPSSVSSSPGYKQMISLRRDKEA